MKRKMNPWRRDRSLGLLSGTVSNGCPRDQLRRIRTKTQTMAITPGPMQRNAGRNWIGTMMAGFPARSGSAASKPSTGWMPIRMDSCTKDELRSAASEFREKGRSQLQEMDTNGDGNISRSEWKGKEEIFNRLDANNDGMLSRDELRAARKPRGTGFESARPKAIRRRCEAQASGFSGGPVHTNHFKASAERSGDPKIWTGVSGERASYRSSQPAGRKKPCNRVRTIWERRIRAAFVRGYIQRAKLPDNLAAANNSARDHLRKCRGIGRQPGSAIHWGAHAQCFSERH